MTAYFCALFSYGLFVYVCTASYTPTVYAKGCWNADRVRPNIAIQSKCFILKVRKLSVKAST